MALIRSHMHAIRFLGYFALFSFLLLATNTAFSPRWSVPYQKKTDFTSGKIDSEERVVPALVPTATPAPSSAVVPTSSPVANPSPATAPTPATVTTQSPSSTPMNSAPTEADDLRKYLALSVRPDKAEVNRKILAYIKAHVTSPFFRNRVTPLSVLVDGTRTEPRWQLSGNTLILASNVPPDFESLKVFVHELGHVIDIYALIPGTFSKDPSSRFYGLSWETRNIKKKGAKLTDFVTGYALTNQYEDFAESFAFYVFHNDEFRRRAMKSDVLARKYAYFRSEVFSDDVFKYTEFSTEQIPAYVWDSTKLPVAIKKYLYYIR